MKEKIRQYGPWIRQECKKCGKPIYSNVLVDALCAECEKDEHGDRIVIT
jgi:hypothetical protein